MVNWDGAFNDNERPKGLLCDRGGFRVSSSADKLCAAYSLVGKRGDRIKILFWDRGGFVVYYKRLARHRFQLPRLTAGADRVMLDGTQLTMLLGGFDPVRTRRTEAWEPTARRGEA